MMLDELWQPDESIKSYKQNYSIQDCTFETIKAISQEYFTSLTPRAFDHYNFIVFGNNNRATRFKNVACFAAINDSNWNDNFPFKVCKYLAVDHTASMRDLGLDEWDTEYCHAHESITLDTVYKWLDFGLNRSQYADAHLVKDPEEVWLKGAILSADFPARYVIPAAVITRYLPEYTAHVEAAVKMMEMGVEDKYILALIHLFQRRRISGEFRWVYQRHGHAHEIFYGVKFKKENFTAFVNNDRSRFDKDRLFSISPKFSNWMGIWGNSSTPLTIPDRSETIIEGDINPFTNERNITPYWTDETIGSVLQKFIKDNVIEAEKG